MERVREYTGRAVANMITTETANRPTGKVRSSDPDYYDTFFDWNVHDLLVERENPSGNRIVYTYETAQKRIANVSKIERFDSEAENEALTEEFSHFAMYADCRCGEQFITRYTAKDENGQTDYDIAFQFDTAGNRTAISYGALSDFPSTFHETFLYNANGQVTAHVFPDNGSAGGYQRRDEMAYYTTGPQTGYLESITADANGQALKTTFAYNAAGRVTGITEPRGHSGGMPQGSWTTLLTYNSNDELIRWRSAEPSGGVARNQVDYVYDANGNVVAVEVENRDAAGILQPNAEFVTTYTYDSLNRQTQAVAEVDESTAVTTQVQYTRNGLPLRILSPLAVSGAEPANTEVRLYDERDLLYRLERGSGSPGQVTTQFDYDANGNLTTATAGLEESAGNRRVTQNVYDAFDRLDTVTDPLGHVRDYAYDGAGRLTQGKVLADGTTLLSQVDYTYDLSGRNTEIARALLDASGAVISGTVNGVDTGNGVSTTTITYTAASDVKTVDFEGHVTEYAYDTLLRLASVTDPKGNVVAYSYDGNSNVVEATSTEQDDTGGPDQEFQTLLSYDQLNRLVARSERYSTVSGGQYNTQTFGYDSRDNRVSRADARGFVATFGYDGLSRPVSSAHEVTAGVWATTATAYDGNSRLISRTDPNGNVTSHAYDALNRPIRVTYADGTAHTLAYNRFGDLTGRTDPTGTTTSQAFDKLGRLTGRTYNPATGFDNPGAKSFTYDALSRMTSATDTDSVAEFEYDSLGNVWNESLTIGGGAERTVASVFDDNGTRKRVTYPGGWTATYTHDDLERVTGIADGGGSIAGYAYVGARMARRTHGNGTQTDYTYDGHGTVNLPGDFGVGRVVEAHHTVTAGGTTLDRHTFQWDPEGNRTRRVDARTAGTGDDFTWAYDGLSRMTARTPDSGGGDTFTYDAAGNRTMAGYALEGADALLHAYTKTPYDERGYDRLGNVASYDARERWYQFDAASRLVKLVEAGSRYEDDFTTLPPVYTPVSGTWAVSGEVLSETSGGTGRILRALPLAAKPKGTLSFGAGRCRPRSAGACLGEIPTSRIPPVRET